MMKKKAKQNKGKERYWNEIASKNKAKCLPMHARWAILTKLNCDCLKLKTLSIKKMEYEDYYPTCPTLIPREYEL